VERILQRQAARFAITADDDESRLYRKVILQIIPFISSEYDRKITVIYGMVSDLCSR
jgi:hypothetical protein